MGVQLAHAGRKALADRRGEAGSLAASPVAFGPGWVAPRAASAEDLAGVVDGFAGAALMAADAGFDVVEVHAAHGYLLHQFLSPLTNFREDDYGGDAAGRRRLLLEVVRAVRAQWPSRRPLFVRLPAGDGQAGGLGIEEVADCARACLAGGADLVDLSGGTPVLGGERAGPRDVLALARALAREPGSGGASAPGTPARRADTERRPRAGVSPPVALGGGIVDGASAQALLEEGHASLVSVGRPLLGDPYWSLRAALELGAPPPLPSAYAEALVGSGAEFPHWRSAELYPRPIIRSTSTVARRCRPSGLGSKDRMGLGRQSLTKRRSVVVEAAATTSDEPTRGWGRGEERQWLA